MSCKGIALVAAFAEKMAANVTEPLFLLYLQSLFRLQKRIVGNKKPPVRAVVGQDLSWVSSLLMSAVLSKAYSRHCITILLTDVLYSPASCSSFSTICTGIRKVLLTDSNPRSNSNIHLHLFTYLIMH